jgi:uncharacterized protein YndB with AHSA1/START domain
MTASVDPSVAAIERELDFAAPPDRVWRALTDSSEVASWFPDRASMPTEVGDVGWMEWDGHPRYRVRLDALEPGRYLAWRWASETDPDFDASATLVEWWLEAASSGGTRLRLRETGFASPDERAGNVEGWVSELGELLEHLADEPWQRGIQRTWSLRSSPDRVWRAFADPAELSVWWGGVGHLEIRPGFEGWWEWPSIGARCAMRIDAVEAPRYLAWRWAPLGEPTIHEAAVVVRDEWLLLPREDGGTDLRLLETGFVGPKDHQMNEGGWDSDVIPGLRRHLGEEEAG